MYSASARDNPINWSFRVGRVFAIDVRLHVLFIIGALYLVWEDSRTEGFRGVGYGLASAGMLFFIVLLHEFGHCWGARRSGGHADEVLLWPLGGLAFTAPRATPMAHFITTAAGPAVNLIFCALAAPALVIIGGSIGAVPWNPLNPFSPLDFGASGGALGHWVRVFFGLNYTLLLFNLMPVYPFDGGRLLHAWLWPRQGRRQATLTATYIGMIGAGVLGVYGFLSDARMLLAIAVFGYVTCFMDRMAAKHNYVEEGDELGYDFSKGYRAFDEADEARPRRPGFWQRRKQAREAIRREQETVQAERLRERVDEILLKIKQHGMNSLTHDERRILEEATERERTSKG